MSILRLHSFQFETVHYLSKSKFLYIKFTAYMTFGIPAVVLSYVSPKRNEKKMLLLENIYDDKGHSRISRKSKQH